MATVLTLAKLKELTGDDNYEVVDSKNAEKRSSVYNDEGRIGLVKKGLKAKDLEGQRIVCVKHDVIGWVFTTSSGTTI